MSKFVAIRQPSGKLVIKSSGLQGPAGANGVSGGTNCYVRMCMTGSLPANGLSSGVITATGNGVAPSIDGLTPIVGDRILVTGETQQKKNGVYTWTSVGASNAPWVLTRAVDWNTAAEFVNTVGIIVSEGSLNKGSYWALEQTSIATLDVDNVSFRRVNANAITRGDALTDANATLSVADGYVHALPINALTAPRTVTLSTTGAAMPMTIAFFIASQSFALSFANGGPNAWTYALPTGQGIFISFRFDGSDWQPNERTNTE